MVLMVGSTGRLGTEICHTLAMKGIPIRALVRDTAMPHKVERLKKYGSLLMVGDLRDSGSLLSACQGVHSIICSASALSSFVPGVNDFELVDRMGVQNLIEIAARSGVEHFVYVSIDLQGEFRSPFLDARHAVEKLLLNSGMVYSILHVSFFLETWFSPEMGFDLSARRAIIFGSGENPISWISIQDVARAAVDALTNPSTDNVVINLRGPKPVSQLHIIRLLERKLHYLFEKEFFPEEYLSNERVMASSPLNKSLFSLFLACASGEEAFYISPTSVIRTGTKTIETLLPTITNASSSGEFILPIASHMGFGIG